MRWLLGICLVSAACGRINFDPLGGGGAGGDGGAGDGNGPGDGPRADILFTTNIMFVTDRNVSPGSFGGLVNADAACQTRAAANGLPGTYVAWLSVSTTNAIDRLAGARGWVRPDGMPFADLPADIAAGRIYMPPAVTADGVLQLDSFGSIVTTGTMANGTLYAGANCQDFTNSTVSVAIGEFNGTSTIFSSTGAVVPSYCNTSRIYCFSIDLNTPLTITPALGRRAFMSSPWSPSGGLAGADAHCDADSASSAGTFRALLSTATATAASRFTTAGPPWVRLDGIELAATASFLLTQYPMTPLNLDVVGQYHGDTDARVWTGADGFDLVSTSHCSDWTVSNGGTTGATSRGDHALERASSNSVCSIPRRLYCLEP